MTVSRHRLVEAVREAAYQCACPEGRRSVAAIRPDAPRLTVIEDATEAALACTQCFGECPCLQPLVQLINHCVMESRRPLGLHVPPDMRDDHGEPLSCIAGG
ncbi:hypothetical protein C882_2222 [Caenispirillum salinarum AK4]|uniref:Uncharacterized protein n=1 Tax=Caenispirillum salinarum AK4 TaxID=1238182 RepID=K9GKR0_9PROT|nr:hypothetical protein [Caenispirillum salinarum]EKV26595.1 hypothetical protein C882_2222 [Caenispirillum salinarum AK4]